jgi:hypothetical protein
VENVVSERRDQYVVTFQPDRGVDGIRALRHVLKLAGRRFGLRAVDAYEHPFEISNKTADEFKELRDEIVARRAARNSPHHEETSS